MTQVQMNIAPHRGYSAAQVVEANGMTLAEIRSHIEQAIEEFGEDAVVFTFDASNRYGAGYGGFDRWGNLFESGNGQCDDCGETLNDDGECEFDHETEWDGVSDLNRA